MKGSEIVLCASIWINDGKEYLYQPKNILRGFVLSGWRHGSILQAMKAMGCTVPASNQVQGFLTTENRFLNRVEARDFVLSTGQLKSTEWGDELYSEDLY